MIISSSRAEGRVTSLSLWSRQSYSATEFQCCHIKLHRSTPPEIPPHLLYSENVVNKCSLCMGTGQPVKLLPLIYTK